MALLRIGVHHVPGAGDEAYLARAFHLAALGVVIVIQLFPDPIAVKVAPFLWVVVVLAAILYLRPRVA